MTAETDRIRALLRQWVLEEGMRPGAQGLADGMDLMQEGFIDSLGLMSLISYVEDLRARALTDEEMRMEHFVSIDSIVDALFGP